MLAPSHRYLPTCGLARTLLHLVLCPFPSRYLKLGELDEAQGMCDALRDQQGLSTEQKSMLAAKENDIVKARQAARRTRTTSAAK